MCEIRFTGAAEKYLKKVMDTKEEDWGVPLPERKNYKRF